MKSYFVTGIGTDVGKTVVSAILSEALHAAYWKPIQSGDLHYSDTIKVNKWTKHVTFIDEKYRLNHALSPHTSARMDGVQISSTLDLPQVEGPLIVEGAGGILVPINDSGETVCDLIKNLGIPTIVVFRHYLGSINHSLLTLSYLKQQGIEIAGIVVTGEPHEESERIIEEFLGRKIDLYIPTASEVNIGFVQEQAQVQEQKIRTWLLG